MRGRRRETQRDMEQDRAMLEAAQRGDAESVRDLVERGADVNAKDGRGWTALRWAAENGHIDVVRLLLERGADVNAKDDDGWTALMGAAENGHIDVVRLLLERGADVNAKSDSGWTALRWAANNGHIDVVRLLLERGADVNAKDYRGWTALLRAAENGHIDVVRLLLERGADVNAKDGAGWTALLRAAKNGHIDVVRLLLERGADVNAKDYDRWTALVGAAENGHIDVVRLLLERGADVNAKDGFGWTALLRAAENGHIDVVRLLLERGADVNAKDGFGWTALLRAAENGHIDVVRLLLERGADVNAKSGFRWTALLRAAENGHIDIVRLLLSRGAHVDASNRNRDTAVRLAASHGHLEVVRVLTPLAKPSQRQHQHRQRTADASLTTSSRPSSWRIPPYEIQLLQYVDTGNIGGDYRAKWLDADVVVKLFVPDASATTFAEELSLWQQLRHPNVIKLYGACDDNFLQFFVCEDASNGSLDAYVKSHGSGQQTPWTFLHQAALGLEFLHERGIVHGDLLCRNFLLGSDGVVKLANFGLSGSARMSGSVKLAMQSGASMRWQAPECLEGGEASFASDVYSLGMCIVEAVTGDVPWGRSISDYRTNDKKMIWKPENDSDTDHDPPGLNGDALTLVRRMCCRDPKKRMSITAVVYELECLVAKEGADHDSSEQPAMDTTWTINTYNHGDTAKLWSDMEALFISKSDMLPHLRQVFKELDALFQRLQTGNQHPSVFKRFHELLADFHTAVKAHQSAEQARIMQLSATRTTRHSFRAFQRRVGLLWRMVGDSTSDTQAREEQWADQRNRQIEFFVSEVSKTWLLLNELESAEERSAFLTFLRDEIENSNSYSEAQLAVMKEAYNDVARHVGPDVMAKRAPEWFIPWYELQDVFAPCLGKGGFGSVHRAKWLDSDVVVKEVLLAGVAEADCSKSWMPRSQSVAAMPSVVVNPAARAKLAEAKEMFKHEADIWFDLSYPHVVRLFGACHVGKPFFVCEFATNGTLVEYLRKHPDDLWRLIYEAALGVQYLHARDIVHGDLKGNNIVIGSDLKAKVTDFGLSSIVTSSGETVGKITGAWQWVAPECLLSTAARPSFESDVYSLGMCVIEAMRVVGRIQTPLPWGNLDKSVVKYHATRGELPEQPSICSDNQWELIKQMCCREPTERMKISTVVDELARLASAHDDGEMHKPTDALMSYQDNHSMEENKRLTSRHLLDIVSSMKELLQETVMVRFSRTIKKKLLGRVDRLEETRRPYRWLCDRLELLHTHTVNSIDVGCLEKMISLAETARVRITQLTDVERTLRELTEVQLDGYALHRCLDKVISVSVLCTNDANWTSFRKWQSYYELQRKTS